MKLVAVAVVAVIGLLLFLSLFDDGKRTAAPDAKASCQREFGDQGTNAVQACRARIAGERFEEAQRERQRRAER
jgi:hypothetical protein